jgi:hypothetical protein
MARTSKKPTGGSLYSVHPGVAMVQKWIAELKGKTGRSLDEWVAFIKKAGPDDEKACRAWLKEAHAWARTPPGGWPSAPAARTRGSWKRTPNPT